MQRRSGRARGRPWWVSLSTARRRVRQLAAEPGAARAAGVLLRPLAGVLLIHDARVGAVLWIVVATDLSRAAFALLGLVLGEGARIALGLGQRPGPEGSLKANALLTALAMAWLLPDEGLSLGLAVLLTAIATLVAAIMTAALAQMLEGTELSPLVLGYSLVAGALFIIFPGWALESALATDWGAVPATLADWIGAFFRSLGAFLFAPSALAGVIIAWAILAWSPAMFLAGLVGWGAGLLVALTFLQAGALFYWLPAAYNFFLAGAAMGSVYFLPGRAALLTAAGAGAIAATIAIGLQHLLDFSSAAFLPVPLCLSVWICSCALRAKAGRGSLALNRFPAMRPEDAWWRTAFDAARWGCGEALLAVPLKGEVEVTQGFSGPLTHVDHWRHALDFARPGRGERERDRPGSILGAPVLAPAPGTVVRVRNDVADNARGASNYADNWGNYVVIALDAGGWALLAHLGQGSVTVAVGSRVDYGTVLGAVGNSGRSPEPHLHLQVQEGPDPGVATRPFRLANYLYAERAGEPLMNWRAAAVPEAGNVLKRAEADRNIHRILAGRSPGRTHWSVEMRGEVPRAFRPATDSTSLRVDLALDSAGRQIITSPDGGRLAARFDADAWRIVELDAARSPFLRLLGLTMPSVPYAASEGVQWTDIALEPPANALHHLAASLLPFRAAPFVTLALRCVESTGRSEGSLMIEAQPVRPDRALPSRLVCELGPHEGPASLVAEFGGGTLVYSLYSFVPSQPQAID